MLTSRTRICRNLSYPPDEHDLVSGRGSAGDLRRIPGLDPCERVEGVLLQGVTQRQPLVEGRDDLLLDALEGFDVAGRDGAEHDLVDTGVDELADSIEDVI